MSKELDGNRVVEVDLHSIRVRDSTLLSALFDVKSCLLGFKRNILIQINRLNSLISCFGKCWMKIFKKLKPSMKLNCLAFWNSFMRLHSKYANCLMNGWKDVFMNFVFEGHKIEIFRN